MRISGLPPSSTPPSSGGDSSKQAVLDALNQMHEIIRKIELSSKFGSCDISKEDVSALQSLLSKIHEALDTKKSYLQVTPSVLKNLDGEIQYITMTAERWGGDAHDIDVRLLGFLSSTITDLQDQLK